MKRISLLILLFISLSIYSFGQNVGDKVDVLWNGTYYKATVKEVSGSKWFIHYDGYDNSWDEWVGKDRIKVLKNSNTPSGGKTDAGNNNSNQGNQWKTGDKVMVKWNDKWYPSTILKFSDGKYKIHYDGWSDSYDEWVAPSRIKNK